MVPKRGPKRGQLSATKDNLNAARLPLLHPKERHIAHTWRSCPVASHNACLTASALCPAATYSGHGFVIMLVLVVPYFISVKRQAMSQTQKHKNKDKAQESPPRKAAGITPTSKSKPGTVISRRSQTPKANNTHRISKGELITLHMHN